MSGEHIVMCLDCGGSGVAPVADQDLGGGSVTNSPCQPCNGHGKVFQGDKWPNYPPGVVMLKLTDPLARIALRTYWFERAKANHPDKEFTRDLLEAIRMQEEAPG